MTPNEYIPKLELFFPVWRSSFAPFFQAMQQTILDISLAFPKTSLWLSLTRTASSLCSNPTAVC